MIRKLILALGILAVVAVPALPAQAQEHHWRNGRGERFERHERFEPRFSFGFYAPGFAFYGPEYYVPAPSCTYEPGHWVSRPSVDAYGNYTYTQEWVPGHNICG